MKKLYILGIQRSGTTMLSSLIGAHPDINMLFESETDDQNKLIGKKYQGNKLCVYTNIKWKRKTNRVIELFHFIVGRFVEIFIHWPLTPNCRFNLSQIIKEDCKIIINNKL